MLSTVSCQTPARQRLTGSNATGSSAAATPGPGPAVAVMRSPGRKEAQSSAQLRQAAQQSQQLIELRGGEQVVREGFGLFSLFAQHLRLVCTGGGEVQSITTPV